VMSVDVFAWISVLYLLVILAGLIAWRVDRDRRDRAANAALVVAERATNHVKIQLNAEREDRRALEGYYILDDSANLDPEWRATMAWAVNELEANDPKGSTS
jgi:hypothetical protein